MTSKMISAVLLSCLAVFLCSSSNSSTSRHGHIMLVDAQLLHPLDHVIGKWNVNLCRKDRKLFESMIFPPRPYEYVEASDDENDYIDDVEDVSASTNIGNNDLKAATSITLQGNQRRFQCELILEEDGTFVLNPPTESEDDSKSTTNQMNNNRLPLKGNWNLRPNPYCVTDRQYDELTLISNPKVRAYFNDNKHNNNIISRSKQEQITLEMNCKVWGRFNSNTIRSFLKRPRGRDAGRMTHGTLSIQKKVIDQRQQLSQNEDSSFFTSNCRRAVCATFNGKPWSKR
jgi:hypothetical protein